MIDGLFEVGRWCKMGMNVEITNVMRISRQQSPR
jgi:UDP-3-O-[3-hydroxymyristoyl] glucosamine N-acyltransferase